MLWVNLDMGNPSLKLTLEGMIHFTVSTSTMNILKVETLPPICRLLPFHEILALWLIARKHPGNVVITINCFTYSYCLQREPGCPYDSSAIRIETRVGARRGYIKREHAEILAPILDIPSVLGGVRVRGKAKWCAESRRCGMKQNSVATISVKKRYLAQLESALKGKTLQYRIVGSFWWAFNSRTGLLFINWWVCCLYLTRCETQMSKYIFDIVEQNSVATISVQKDKNIFVPIRVCFERQTTKV